MRMRKILFEAKPDITNKIYLITQVPDIGEGVYFDCEVERVLYI